MTTIYFVRHCKPDGKIKDDRNRPLTEEGREDSIKVAEILKDKIQTDERLRERKAGENGNNHEMFKKRWADFAFAEEDGESIGAVQKRNIEALNEILEKYDGKNIVIGTHGTALSSIINYYDKSFNSESFMKIIDFMPWILKMEFDGKKFLCKEDVFHIQKEYKE